jgi:hypothetical protein
MDELIFVFQKTNTTVKPNERAIYLRHRMGLVTVGAHAQSWWIIGSQWRNIIVQERMVESAPLVMHV